MTTKDIVAAISDDHRRMIEMAHVLDVLGDLAEEAAAALQGKPTTWGGMNWQLGESLGSRARAAKNMAKNTREYLK